MPGEGETLIRVSLAGINYADTHARQNDYLARFELPLIPGSEVAGTTEDGTRVAAIVAHGGYAEYALAPVPIPIPAGVTDQQALALLIQGLTAWHLYKTSARVQPGETVVVHAAAGGVGSLAVQLGKEFGARVIATASTPEKRELALELGADAAVDVNDPDLSAACAGPTTASASTSCSRWPAGACSTRRWTRSHRSGASSPTGSRRTRATRSRAAR